MNEHGNIGKHETSLSSLVILLIIIESIKILLQYMNI